MAQKTATKKPVLRREAIVSSLLIVSYEKITKSDRIKFVECDVRILIKVAVIVVLNQDWGQSEGAKLDNFWIVQNVTKTFSKFDVQSFSSTVVLNKRRDATVNDIVCK